MGCCNFAWSGFGGLKFLRDGALETPWGKGLWGAPPEAQQAAGQQERGLRGETRAA